MAMTACHCNVFSSAWSSQPGDASVHASSVMPKCLTQALERFDTRDRRNLNVSLHAAQQSLVHVSQGVSTL